MVCTSLCLVWKILSTLRLWSYFRISSSKGFYRLPFIIRPLTCLNICCATWKLIFFYFPMDSQCPSPFINKPAFLWASPLAQRVKSLPAMWETQVLSLGWENPLEKGMATHPSILAWRIPRTEEPGGLHGVAESRTGLSNWHFTFFSIFPHWFLRLPLSHIEVYIQGDSCWIDPVDSLVSGSNLCHYHILLVPTHLW